MFAFHFRGDYPDDGWEIFDMEAELKRLVSTITNLDTNINTVPCVTHKISIVYRELVMKVYLGEYVI